jgi:putative transposase
VGYTTQDCSGVLPDGTLCGEHIHKSLSMRTHMCPRCGLILDRDENAAVNILACGVALAREHGRWPQEAGEPSEPTELRGPVGHTGTYRLGRAGLLRRGESPAVAPAGGARNLPDSSGQSVKYCARL